VDGLADTNDFFKRAVSHFVTPVEKLTGLGLWLPPADSPRILPPVSTVCPFRKNKVECPHCLQTHADLRVRARKGVGTQTIVCPAGLRLGAVPIRDGTRVVRFLECIFGLHDRPNPAVFEAVMREAKEIRSKGSLEKLRAAYMETPVLPPPQADEAAKLLGFVAALIARDLGREPREEEAVDLDPLQKAARFIETNFRDKLRLSTVARAAGFSDDYFSRLFRQTTGVSFKDYVARRRIAHAQELLLNKDKRISEVAYACGFESISHFNRSFKQFTQTSPKVYRSERRNLSL
jgi:AraC-like DNA-binding protein